MNFTGRDQPSLHHDWVIVLCEIYGFSKVVRSLCAIVNCRAFISKIHNFLFSNSFYIFKGISNIFIYIELNVQAVPWTTRHTHTSTLCYLYDPYMWTVSSALIVYITEVKVHLQSMLLIWPFPRCRGVGRFSAGQCQVRVSPSPRTQQECALISTPATP